MSLTRRITANNNSLVVDFNPEEICILASINTLCNTFQDTSSATIFKLANENGFSDRDIFESTLANLVMVKAVERKINHNKDRLNHRVLVSFESNVDNIKNNYIFMFLVDDSGSKYEISETKISQKINIEEIIGPHSPKHFLMQKSNYITQNEFNSFKNEVRRFIKTYSKFEYTKPTRKESEEINFLRYEVKNLKKELLKKDQRIKYLEDHLVKEKDRSSYKPQQDGFLLRNDLSSKDSNYALQTDMYAKDEFSLKNDITANEGYLLNNEHATKDNSSNQSDVSTKDFLRDECSWSDLPVTKNLYEKPNNFEEYSPKTLSRSTKPNNLIDKKEKNPFRQFRHLQSSMIRLPSDLSDSTTQYSSTSTISQSPASILKPYIKDKKKVSGKQKKEKKLHFTVHDSGLKTDNSSTSWSLSDCEENELEDTKVESMHHGVFSITDSQTSVYVLHAGTNDLSKLKSAEKLAEDIVEAALKIKKKDNDVIVSSVYLQIRSLDTSLQDVNTKLLQLCRKHGLFYLDNDNVTVSSHLNRTGIHLNKHESNVFAKNLFYILGN